jgi:GDP-L-fucose synthase
MTVLVAGGSGLAGSAIVRALEARGERVLAVNSKVVDLTDRKATFEYILDHKPTHVIDAAARVGGIGANSQYPVDFLSENIQIQTNLMDASHEAKVERFVFLGSSCIYPKMAEQPMKESALLTGPLEATNSAYAIAKISGIELIKSYRKQFKHRWISVMPTNLYGPRDNFDLNTSHVLPAMIRKFDDAVNANSEVTLWGTGSPKREFLHTDDLAQAIILLMEKYDEDQHINVGSSEELTIKELAQLIAGIAGYNGEIKWDLSKPDGTPRKIMDNTRISALGWHPNISLKDGISSTLNWYRENR